MHYIRYVRIKEIANKSSVTTRRAELNILIDIYLNWKATLVCKLSI